MPKRQSSDTSNSALIFSRHSFASFHSGPRRPSHSASRRAASLPLMFIADPSRSSSCSRTCPAAAPAPA